MNGNIFIPWTYGGWEIGASARDFARIGWFWLNRGEWDGAQLISRSLFDEHMKVGVPATMPLASGNLDPNGDYLAVGTNAGRAAGLLDFVNFNGGRNIYGFDWWFNGQPVTTTTTPTQAASMATMWRWTHATRLATVLAPLAKRRSCSVLMAGPPR